MLNDNFHDNVKITTKPDVCVYNMVTLNCRVGNCFWVFNIDLIEMFIEQLRADSGNSAGCITVMVMEGEGTVAGLC